MNKSYIFGLMIVVLICLSVGCESRDEDPFVGATANGRLNEVEEGSNLAFGFEVEEEGDPIGINFQGTLAEGSIKLQVINAEDEIYEEWVFNETGPFSLNTTLYPPSGSYHYGMAWDGPVQLPQYSLAWKPFSIESPIITGLVLLPGIGMILVAIGFLVYAGIRRLGWRYLALGAVGWIITVALKFAWAIPVNSPIYEALTGALPEVVADTVFYIYVGALTGVFEVALVWLVLRYTRLGKAAWERALAFGIGFGAVEAFLLGIASLTSGTIALTMPTTLPVEALEQIALANNPLYGLAPVWERFFVVLVHIFTAVLIFYGARKREWRWFWFAFLYKTSIDAIAAFAQFWGVDSLARLWFIEGLVAIWGIVAWFGIRAIRERYLLLDEEARESVTQEQYTPVSSGSPQ